MTMEMQVTQTAGETGLGDEARTTTERLIRLIGSPFVENSRGEYSDAELLDAYDAAFPDRVASLYLTLHRRPGWDPELEARYQALLHREEMTRSVIVQLAERMNEFDPESYVIFKSLKPYPATPNDTDILFLGTAAGYEKAYQHLLDSGYVFHEWAPQQRTVYDPRGVGKIGRGKKGGTYYVDFYVEISTDYFAYSNKHRLRPHVVRREMDGVQVNLLRPEPELAIVLFHNVFPERTFQLEHFYLPLYYFHDPAFDMEAFVEFTKEERYRTAVSANLTLVADMHERMFGCVPDPVRQVLDALGRSPGELARFREGGSRTPYMFSQRTFWSAFAEKCRDPYALRSLGVQAVKMLNPVFFLDVVGALRRRLSEKGSYHLE